MTGRRCSFLVAAITTLALVGAATATAAERIVSAGPGGAPHVAADAAGTGYLTWVDSSTSTFHYCRLPAAATACTAPFAYADANQDLDGAHALLPPDGRVLLLDMRGVTPGRPKLLWTSTDGGTTFAGPTQLSTMPITGSGLGVNPLFLPAGTLGLPTETIVTLSELAGVTANLQATGTTAGTTDAVVQLTPNVATALGISGNTLIAALSDFGTLNWSQYVGPIPATADALNVATNWSAPAAIGPRYGAELETRLASGPAGIYVGYVVPTGVAADQELVVRKFDGAGWSAPVTIARNVSFPDLVQDPAGRLHALWADTAGLHYRSTTNAANTTWDAGQLIATGDHYAVARLSVNAAGNGWATWAGSTGVQAIPLHGFYTGPAVATTDSGFGADYQLKGIPKGCVQPGQQFTVTLSWKRQKRKGNLFVKVRRTDFYLGTSKLRTDNSAPFTYTFQVRVTQPRGSTVSLRARAFIKVRHGKTPKKSIFAKVKVCAAP